MTPEEVDLKGWVEVNQTVGRWVTVLNLDAILDKNYDLIKRISQLQPESVVAERGFKISWASLKKLDALKLMQIDNSNFYRPFSDSWFLIFDIIGLLTEYYGSEDIRIVVS